MSHLLKATMKDKINNWIAMFLYRRVGIKCGPFMFYSRGEWWFVDHVGNIYNIRYSPNTAYDNIPLVITLYQKV